MTLANTQNIDLTGCVTREDLADLLEHAFAQWRQESRTGKERRDTPRLAVPEECSIHIASWALHGEQSEMNVRATIVDVSADGLGLMLQSPLPNGAQVLFAFAGDDGECQYGVATIVRCSATTNGYRIGLSFDGPAGSLDTDDSTDEVVTPTIAAPGCRRGFGRLREAASSAREILTTRQSAAQKWRRITDEMTHVDWRGEMNRLIQATSTLCHTVTSRTRARRVVERAVGDQHARFVVEAKLFRYTASLYVNGVRVASRTGILRDRLRNLCSTWALPTMIRLETEDFSGWATMQANAVLHCTLDLTVQKKHELGMQILRGAYMPEQFAADGATKLTPALN